VIQDAFRDMAWKGWLLVSETSVKECFEIFSGFVSRFIPLKKRGLDGHFKC